jgi:hypothetical protein
MEIRDVKKFDHVGSSAERSGDCPSPQKPMRAPAVTVDGVISLSPKTLQRRYGAL